MDHSVIVVGSLAGTAVAKTPSSKGKGKGKASKGRGNSKTVDPVTGRYIQETEGGTNLLVRDDVTYHTTDDSLIAIRSTPVQINGVLTLDGIPIEHPDAIVQVQLGDRAIVIDNSRSTMRQRDVYLGDFRYNKKGMLLGGTVEYRAYLEEKSILITHKPPRP